MAKRLPPNYCPLIKDSCVEAGCAWWVMVQGMHPQTGEIVNQGNCAMAWLPILQIDNTQQLRGASASADNARNAMATLAQAVTLQDNAE